MPLKSTLSSNGKAIADAAQDGFVKIIYDLKSKEVLGVHIAAYNASDLIGEAMTLMIMGGHLDDFKKVVHPHPTFSHLLVDSI